MDKLASIKEDYDTLSRLHNERVASHNADLSQLEPDRGEEPADEAEGRDATPPPTLQKCTWFSCCAFIPELSKVTAQNDEPRIETEEVTRHRTLQLKATKDSERHREERNSVISKYRLVMSERDHVIREADKLWTEPEAANASSQSKIVKFESREPESQTRSGHS
ncbi:hypothetical protein AAFF_G00139670 [Aldrovandia affinis]|uniref:Uncharacterized protein n=1 Tax=Aldrovandia affinis TaxID=143900 RepID=A0AAD7X2X8_9TELE|nr:hypothetical protein AAFF_G00139670 [Aldrovandia affinis]